MQKYLLIAAAVVFSTTLSAQVLYTENFNSLTIGNLGTDTTGATPGQGGWFTHTDVWTAPTPVLGPNTDYQIAAESGKGNVLKIQCMQTTQHVKNKVFRTGLKTLWQQRTTGNNVLKFTFDYFTEDHNNVSADDRANTFFYNNQGELLFGYGILVKSGSPYFNIPNKPNGNTSGMLEYANGQQVLLPKNTWVTFELYVDYTNSKIYYSIPYLNYTVAFNILALDPNGNGDRDGMPDKLVLENYAIGVNKNFAIKFDNIGIAAQNTVPTLSINEQLAAKFNLYPNPATNVVNITNAENMQVQQVTIYDSSGKQLSTQSFNNETQIQLNIENLPSGTYMLHLQTNEGTAVKKLVKK